MYEKWKMDIKKNYKKLLVTIIIVLLSLFVISNIRINLTPSSPLGVYFIYKGKRYKKYDYVVYKIDENYKKYLNEKMKDLMTIKQIAATCGDRITIENDSIFINNTYMGKMLKGIPTRLPNELVLTTDEVFTLSSRPDSLDGRYYGAIKIKDIKSKAILLKKIKWNESKQIEEMSKYRNQKVDIKGSVK